MAKTTKPQVGGAPKKAAAAPKAKAKAKGAAKAKGKAASTAEEEEEDSSAVTTEVADWMPKKKSDKSSRQREKPNPLKGIALGVKKNFTFLQNCEELRQTISTTGRNGAGELTYTPSEAHVMLTSLFAYWKTGDDKEAKEPIFRLKSWVEGEWPEEFEGHDDAEY